MTEDHNGLRVLVLGPVAVAVGSELTPLRGQQGEVLCALAARYPGSVPAEQLHDLLWPAGAPRTARTGLGVVVHRLRERWPGTEFIVNEAGAYRLVVPPEALDSVRFEREVGYGSALTGDPGTAARLLEAALKLWRGDAFQPFDRGAILSAPATFLTELRRDTEELLVERLLEAGEAENAAMLAARYVEVEPYRERRWQQLMLALYRTDRQAEALRVAQRAARVLRDDLGIEPGNGLRILERKILEQSHEIDGPVLEVPDVRHFVESLNLLPDTVPTTNNSFIGRLDELAVLTTRVEKHGFVTVVGGPGAGKSRLVAEYARGAADRRVIWIDLVPLDDNQVVSQMAEQLGVNTSHDNKTLAIARSLASTPTTVVFDNSAHLVPSVSAISTALLSAVPGLQIVVTSRMPLSCEGEVLVELAPLSKKESRQLVHSRAFGTDATDCDTSTIDVSPVSDLLDGVPLFLELIAPALSTVSPVQLGEELRSTLSSLSAAGRSDRRHQTLATALDWSIDLLPPAVASTYNSLGVLGTSFGIDDVCALVDLDRRTAREHLHTLARHYLVVNDRESADASFGMLMSTRAHAIQRLEACGELEATRRRHALHYADLAGSLAAEFAGPNELDALKQMNRAAPQFDIAHKYLTSAADALEPAARLVNSLFDYSFMGLRYSQYTWADEVLNLPGIETIDHYGGLLATAALLAWARDDLSRAARLASESVTVSEQRGHAPSLLAFRARLNIAAYEHNFGEAAVALMSLIGESERQGDERELAVSLVTQTLGEFQSGMHAGAVRSANRSLKLAERTGNPSTIAWAQFAVGTTLMTSEPVEAIRRFTSAIRLAKQVENRFVEGMALGSLAAVLRRSGRANEAAPILADVVLFWGRTKTDSQVGYLAREAVVLLHTLERPDLAAKALHLADRFDRVPPLMGDDHARFETIAVELRAGTGLLDLDATLDVAERLSALLHEVD